MECSPVMWHALLGAFGLSIFLASLHTSKLQSVFQAASALMQGPDPTHRHPVLADIVDLGASSKNVEAAAAHQLDATLTGESGTSWARWFGTGEASDDALDEDAIRLLLKDAEVLENQWRLRPAEQKLHEASRRVSRWLSDMRKDKKPIAQRDRAAMQAVDVLLSLGRFLEDRGRAEEAMPSLRLANKLAATLTSLPSWPGAVAKQNSFAKQLAQEHRADVLATQVRSEAGLARTLCLAGGRQGAAVTEARMLFTMALGHKPDPSARLKAQVHADFAECLHREGALAEARAGIVAARSLLAEAGHGNGWSEREQAALERRLVRLEGGVSHDDGAFADAVHLYGKYLQSSPELQERLPALVEVLQRFEVMQDLSLALASLGRMDEAFGSMDDVDHLQKTSGDELQLKSHLGEATAKFLARSSLDGHLQASVARSRVVRAELALEQSRLNKQRPPKKAQLLAQEAVTMLRDASALAADLENALNTLGNVQMSLGEASHAQDAYRFAVKLAVADHGKNNPLVAALYHNLASALEATGKLPDAIKLYTEALDIQTATLGEANPDTAGSLDSLARCLERNGQLTKASEVAQRAAKAARAAYPEGHWLRRETEGRLKKLQSAALATSEGFHVAAREAHLVAQA